MSDNGLFYQKQLILRRVTDSVSYSNNDGFWVELYTSPELEYDADIVEFKLTLAYNGSPLPTSPVHRIMTIRANDLGSPQKQEIYPYESSGGEVTVSGDVVGLLPSITVPKGSSFVVEVSGTGDNSSSEVLLDYLELAENR